MIISCHVISVCNYAVGYVKGESFNRPDVLFLQLNFISFLINIVLVDGNSLDFGFYVFSRKFRVKAFKTGVKSRINLGQHVLTFFCKVFVKVTGFVLSDNFQSPRAPYLMVFAS